MRSRAGFRPQAFASRTAAESSRPEPDTAKLSIPLAAFLPLPPRGELFPFESAGAFLESRSRRTSPRRDARSQPDGDRLRGRSRRHARGRLGVFRLSAAGPVDSARRRARRQRGAGRVAPSRSRARQPDGNAKGPVAALAAAGVPVLAVPGGSLGAVIAGIRLVAPRACRADARQTVSRANSRGGGRRSGRSVARCRRRPRAVLLVWPDPPQAAGGRTFLNDLLAEAGAQNLLAARPGWPLVSAEWLATAPIEVLVLPDSAETRPAYRTRIRRRPSLAGRRRRAPASSGSRSRC